MKKIRTSGFAQRIHENFLLMMRLAMLFLLMAFVPFTATALGQRITIKLDQADLEEVLDVVRQKMGYMFVYNNQMVKDAGKISVDVTSDDVNYILKKCLEGTSLDFYVEDNIVVIVTKSGQVVRDADKKVVTVKESGRR